MAGGFWNELPADRVVRLAGDAAAISACLDPLPDDAPAVVTYLPHAETTASTVVEAMLRELAAVAVELFPQWLPAVSTVGAANSLSVAAVRMAAHEIAATSDHFGPFLADLAECGLRRSTTGLTRFSPEMRAVGLIRILTVSYSRPQAAILVAIPDGLSPACQQALASACEWMAHHGHVGIWLVGSLEAHDRIRSVEILLPDHLTRTESPEQLKRPTGPVIVCPPLAGRPHPGSTAEQRLETALQKRTWAAGRAWNHVYHSHPLVNPVRLDLWWRDERFVVEIDGPEHRSKWRFVEDRRRDRMLHNDGITVLRFTNADVLEDLDAVLATIEQFLHKRRAKQWELSDHA